MASEKTFDSTSSSPDDSLQVPDFPSDIHNIAIYNQYEQEQRFTAGEYKTADEIPSDNGQ